MELDQWIAENVTKVGKIRNPEEWDNEFPNYGHEEFIYPRYTSDMNEAIKVLAALDMQLSIGRYDNKDWVVDDDNLIEKGENENPAMAICLAAYKIKTGKDWNEKL